MTSKFRLIIQLLFMASSLLLLWPGTGLSVGAPQAEFTPSSDEIESVINTLETTAEREALIKNLKIIAQANQPAASNNQIKSAAAQMLSDISEQVHNVTGSIFAVGNTINEVPIITAWAKTELSEPKSRKILTEVVINIILTLGFGYLGFYLVRLALLSIRRTANVKEPRNFLFRLLGLLGILTIDLLPIIAFAVAAYLTLSIVGPLEKTRLVALAWVNAFILSHSLIALLNVFLAPHSSSLRLSRLLDENANYLMIWGKRLSYTTVYGYFALQAALLLGLPFDAYEAMLRILGMFVTLFIIIMILQNRETVAQYIALRSFEKTSDTEKVTTPEHPYSKVQQHAQGIRIRLAKTWHLLALMYVILLYGVWALRIPGGFFFLFRATALTIIALFVTRTILVLLNVLFTKGFNLKDELKARFLGLEKRANQYLSTLHIVLRVCTYFLGFMTVLQAWGLHTLNLLSSEPGRVLGGTIASVGGIILVTFIIWEIANNLIENSLSPKKINETNIEVNARTLTLLTVTRKALAIVLTVVATLMVLAEIGLNIAPLLAGAGVLGLAIGFGSQKLVQDVITGVFILLEDQIAVGDVVDLGGLAGVVEAVSIRTVRLRDVTGTVHTIPFSAISTVSNKTKYFSYYVMDVGIGYRESVDDVMVVLKEIGADLQSNPEYAAKILEPLEILGVDAFADSAVIIKARIKTVPTKQWWVGREFNRLMKNKFDELDIEIPFPHQTIYFGVDKKGQAPPARLSMGSDSVQNQSV